MRYRATDIPAIIDILRQSYPTNDRRTPPRPILPLKKRPRRIISSPSFVEEEEAEAGDKENEDQEVGEDDEEVEVEAAEDDERRNIPL